MDAVVSSPRRGAGSVSRAVRDVRNLSLPALLFCAASGDGTAGCRGRHSGFFLLPYFFCFLNCERLLRQSGCHPRPATQLSTDGLSKVAAPALVVRNLPETQPAGNCPARRARRGRRTLRSRKPQIRRRRSITGRGPSSCWPRPLPKWKRHGLRAESRRLLRP